jgi:hypothetical protein
MHGAAAASIARAATEIVNRMTSLPSPGFALRTPARTMLRTASRAFVSPDRGDSSYSYEKFER